MNQATIDYLRQEYWVPTAKEAERGHAVTVNLLLDRIELLTRELRDLVEYIEADLPQIESGDAPAATAADMRAAIKSARRVIGG